MRSSSSSWLSSFSKWRSSFGAVLVGCVYRRGLELEPVVVTVEAVVVVLGNGTIGVDTEKKGSGLMKVSCSGGGVF